MKSTQPFYNTVMEEALRACQTAGYEAAYMPELAERRIKAKNDSSLWKMWWATPSLRITGTTKGQSKVVLYVHDQTSWNDSEQLKYAREHRKNGAGPFPQEEFYALVNRVGDGKVFLVDYDTLKRSTSGIISVDSALSHPQIIPFLGGEKIAEKYLVKHRRVYGNNIGIWHSNDLDDVPRGRLLFLGSDLLGGDGSLGGDARFLGVRRSGASVSEPVSAEGASAPVGREARKIISPDLEAVIEQFLADSHRYVLPKNRREYDAFVRERLGKVLK